MDAVSKGVLDAGHHVSGYWYGKSKVASLFGTGPVNGATPEIGLTLDLRAAAASSVGQAAWPR